MISSPRGNAKALARALWIVLFNVIVAGGVLELFFVLMLHSPGLTASSPVAVQRLVQQVYRHFNRQLIQFDARCARYDADVTYTLRPGACTFENLEFTNTYEVNRLGLRDSNEALTAPEIIVLGDSHAMGWGVAQNETFAARLRERTGRRVLNAAVSSYATVREMRMLDRLDASALKVLILQYSDNDQPENRTFAELGNRLPITDEAHYQRIVDHYASQRRYYPGKYMFRLFMKLTRLEAAEPDQLRMDALSPSREAELFLNAVSHAGHTPLDGVALVVLEVSQEPTHPRAFIEAVRALAPKADAPPFVRNLVTFDTTRVLTPDDFYVLDDHMRSRGHAAIGDGLATLVAPLFARR